MDVYSRLCKGYGPLARQRRHTVIVSDDLSIPLDLR